MTTLTQQSAQAKDFAQEVRDFAQEVRTAHDHTFQGLQAKYWELHARLSETRFDIRWDQIVAIKELSELGLALHGMAQAYHAINTAACITD